MKPKNMNSLTGKNQFTFLSLFLALMFCLSAKGQITVADFESFTLTPSSAYSPTTSTPFQTANAGFQYQYNSTFQFWSGGFAYTNITDSSTAGFGNLYGVRAYRGYNNSTMYVVGQDRGVVKTTTVPQTTVAGFYVTNTTYAYKSMAKGDAFARKFGDTTGTGSGTTIPQGSYPDYFKLIVKGYKNGSLKNDSVTVMLADFTYTNNTQDFILNSWQFVNTAIIGEVDSIKFFMRSSDMSFGFMNTPGFFALDNFTTGKYDETALSDFQMERLNFDVYPNPAQNTITLDLSMNKEQLGSASFIDLEGRLVYSVGISSQSCNINLNDLKRGVYVLEVTCGDQRAYKKVILN